MINLHIYPLVKPNCQVFDLCTQITAFPETYLYNLLTFLLISFITLLYAFDRPNDHGNNFIIAFWRHIDHYNIFRDRSIGLMFKEIFICILSDTLVTETILKILFDYLRIIVVKTLLIWITTFLQYR